MCPSLQIQNSLQPLSGKAYQLEYVSHRKQNTQLQRLDHEHVHFLPGKRDVKPKAPGLLPSLMASPRTFSSSAVPSWATPPFTQPEDGKAGIHMQDYLMLGMSAMWPVLRWTIFFYLPSILRSDMVTHLNVSSNLVPVHWLLCKVLTSICDLVKCGFALTVSFSKLVVHLISGISAYYQAVR